MADPEPIDLNTGSRQTDVKIGVKIIAIMDLVHYVVPICYFTNLLIAAAVTVLGGPNSSNRFQSVVYFAPVAAVSIVIFAYGVIIAIRLFNSAHPGMSPAKSAQMALGWWHYTIFLVIFQLFTTTYYFSLTLTKQNILNKMFSLLSNFSIAIRLIFLFLVRKFIKDMRSYENRVAPESGRGAVLQIPHIAQQRRYHMKFMAKTLLIVDLVHDSFMVLCLLYAFVSVTYKYVGVEDDFSYQPIIHMVFGFVLVVIFYFPVHTGFKLLKATDKYIVDNQPIYDMPPDIQLLIHKTIRKWMFCSVGCIVIGEIFSVWLIVVNGDSLALTYTLGLSFSFGVRVVSCYLIRRFKRESFNKPNENSVGMSSSSSLPRPSCSRETKVAFGMPTVQPPRTSEPSPNSESVQIVTVPSSNAQLPQESSPSPNVQLPQASSPSSNAQLPQESSPSPNVQLPQASSPSPNVQQASSPSTPSPAIPIRSSLHQFLFDVEEDESQSAFWTDTEKGTPNG